MTLFASNIKVLRKSKNFNQVEMCASIGFKQSSWSAYETDNSKPSFEDLLKIIDYFGITASELLEKDLQNVHLNKNDNDKNEDINVHLNVHANVHLNTKKAQKEPCGVCV